MEWNHPINAISLSLARARVLPCTSLNVERVLVFPYIRIGQDFQRSCFNVPNVRTDDQRGSEDTPHAELGLLLHSCERHFPFLRETFARPVMIMIMMQRNVCTSTYSAGSGCIDLLPTRDSQAEVACYRYKSQRVIACVRARARARVCVCVCVCVRLSLSLSLG